MCGGEEREKQKIPLSNSRVPGVIVPDCLLGSWDPGIPDGKSESMDIATLFSAVHLSVPLFFFCLVTPFLSSST